MLRHHSHAGHLSFPRPGLDARRQNSGYYPVKIIGDQLRLSASDERSASEGSCQRKPSAGIACNQSRTVSQPSRFNAQLVESGNAIQAQSAGRLPATSWT